MCFFFRYRDMGLTPLSLRVMRPTSGARWVSEPKRHGVSFWRSDTPQSREPPKQSTIATQGDHATGAGSRLEFRNAKKQRLPLCKNSRTHPFGCVSFFRYRDIGFEPLDLLFFALLPLISTVLSFFFHKQQIRHPLPRKDRNGGFCIVQGFKE